MPKSFLRLFRRRALTETPLSKAASWAAIATAFTAVIGLLIAIWQIDIAQKVQREASANEAFKEYLKFAIDKPELANGGVKKGEESKYSWFISYFLFSAEQIYKLYPDDKAWLAALSDQICYHRQYLTGEEYKRSLKPHYDETFSSFVEDALKKCSR